MKKKITAQHKKKRPQITKFNLEKIHDYQLEIIDRFSAVYKLNESMRTLWEVIFKSGHLIAGQLKILKEKTGETYSYYKYWKLRRKLMKELAKA